MFIREIKKSNKGYNKQFVYHHLVESYRTDNGPRQRVLLNLGKLNIAREQWKQLANRIEEILNGQSSLLEMDSEIESLAQHYAGLLVQKNIYEQKENNIEDSQFEEIDINSIKTSTIRTIGSEYFTLETMKKLGFDKIFKDLGFTDKQTKVAKMLIIGRMVYPASEFATFKWAHNLSAIGELLNLRLEGMSHNILYRVSDLLIDNQEFIENSLCKTERDLFSLKEKIILYDLTNTYFESSSTSDLKKYGRSKEKRNDQPLVTLGLTMDEKGFPKRSHIFEGNVSEPESFKKILKELEATSEGEKTFIMDAGISAEENLKLIKSHDHEYIVVARNKPVDENPKEGFVTIRHSHQGIIEARIIKKKDETILYCRSDLKRKKEASMRTRFSERFEADLTYAKESLKKKRGTKKYSKVLERIGRLKQKHTRIAYLYEISVKEKDGIVTDITWKISNREKMDERFNGGYYLRTSRTDLTEQEIWDLYVSLTDVEDSFRSMKSYLGLRPNFHQKDERIKGHIFISVLAHHVVNTIQTLLHNNGVFLQWGTIRELLSVQHRVTTQMTNRKGDVIHLRNTSEPEPFHYLMADSLSIKPKPLWNRTVKT
jgi:transposase